MSPLSNSVTPSAVVRRSARSTLLATGPSAGSLIRRVSSETAGGATRLFLVALDGEGHVVTPEAEAVAQHAANRAMGRGVGRVVEVELRIRRLIVDRRRDDAVANRQRADDELHRAGRAEHVTGHG